MTVSKQDLRAKACAPRLVGFITKGVEEMLSTSNNSHIKRIEGFSGYFVTSSGEVLSQKRGNKPRSLRADRTGRGYLVVRLFRKEGDTNRRHGRAIHNLVAEAFLPKYIATAEVNHIDGDKENNRVSNLEWVSHSENINHAYQTGLINKRKLFDSKRRQYKLSEELVEDIKRLRKQGETLAKIARLFGVHHSTISRASNGLSWSKDHMKAGKL